MKVGFVGWRGMVGSVLMQRMQEEQDFKHIPESVFFTTSNVGGTAPDFGQTEKTLLDANNITELAKNILRARASNSGKTLAELYDPDKMPDGLREAHRSHHFPKPQRRFERASENRWDHISPAAQFRQKPPPGCR